MRNVKELKTTIIGLIIWVATGLYFVTPYFSDKELWEIDNIYVISGVVAGLLLLLAPDKFVTFLFGWLSKKTN